METTGSLQRILLTCGILAPLMYLGTDRLAGSLFKGYSFSARSMSDLGASGSPVRTLVIPLTLLAAVLMIAFGVGVWRAAGQELLPRIVSALVIINASAGWISTLLFPNRLGERPDFVSPGVLLMFLSVLCFFLAMLIGALAYSGWFRLLSIAIPAAYILLAVLRFATASSAGGDSVLIGSQERTMAYSFLLWVAALAINLFLQSGRGGDI